MKSLREKFKQKVDFVRPLYKKVRIDNRVKPTKKLFVSVDVINDSKLYGNGVYVKRKIIKDNFDYNKTFEVGRDSTDRTLIGTCRNQRDINIQSVIKSTPKSQDLSETKKTKNRNVNRTVDSKMESIEDNSNITKLTKADKAALAEKVLDTWLRVYPAAQAPGECAPSVVMRCVVSQLGLAAFLALWTVTWVFVIQHFEGPFETAVSDQFEKEQNQLVIDLATELRQITPLSPKWKYAIEKRIEDERKLTMVAVARGAKLHLGQFWDLSGTFLFTVYVMTALGFGAPVPQTILGRTSALIYAALAVPTHIYLMVNASTCLVANVESNLDKFKTRRRRKEHHITSTSETGNSNSSRNSELMKPPNRSLLRRKVVCIMQVVSSGRCVPLATVLYYAVGAICFGLVRGRKPLEIVMFPLEFTTTGGLEVYLPRLQTLLTTTDAQHDVQLCDSLSDTSIIDGTAVTTSAAVAAVVKVEVESYVRVLYGFYVEGAMSLLACALATLRRHSCATMTALAEKYRLFTTEPMS